MSLKDYLPPVLYRAIRKLRSPKLFDSWSEAQTSCGKQGYQQESLLEIIFEKTRRHRAALDGGPRYLEPRALRLMLAISLARRGESVSVLDFGGACGADYFTMKSVFGDSLAFRWNVVETPGMVLRGQRLAAAELAFFEDLQAAAADLGEPDLLLSSSALPYVPEPYRMLEAFLACRARFVFLTRLPLTTGGRDLVHVQHSAFGSNGPGPLPPGMEDGTAAYPMTAARRSEVERILGSSYRTLYKAVEEENVFWLAGEPIHEYGFFARRN